MLSLDRRARAHDVAPLPNVLRRRKERRAPEQGTGVSGNQALADEILSSRITRPLESSYLNRAKSHGQITYNLATRQLAALAEARDFRVLVDEVYLEWLYDAYEPHSAINLSPRFVTTRSLSKV